MSNEATASPTELTDSLLHTNWKRVALGVVCGLLAGLFMLVASQIVVPQGMGRTWWVQLLGSAFFGGDAMAYDAGSPVLVIGLVLHFTIAGFLGLVFGKITTNRSFTKNLFYGFVLGILCWIASNLFGPNFLSIPALAAVEQWPRFFLLQSFTLALGFFMTVTSRALDA